MFETIQVPLKNVDQVCTFHRLIDIENTYAEKTA